MSDDAQLSTDPALDLYGSLIEPDRLVYPKSPEEHQDFIDKLLVHHRQGGHIAIVDGAFDVPHDNHAWYLRHCRIQAAKRHFGDKFSASSRPTKFDLVSSNVIKLIVTVDADFKVAQKKSFILNKGNIRKPVYPWEARANIVGGYTIPDSSGKYQSIVDIVTVEGDPNHRGTALESHIAFGHALHDLGILDTWLLYGEHDETIRKATEIAGNVVCVISQDEVIHVVDPRTGQKWSSSYIIKQITQDFVL